MGGRPKGLETVGSARIIDRVVSSLLKVTQRVVLVANEAEAPNWLDNVSVVRDVHAGFGGLAGVHAALSSIEDVLVVAWDMPFVSPKLLSLILDRSARPDTDVVVPESESPYGFEPFCAFYSVRVQRPLDAFLSTGGGAARDFLATIPGVHRIPLADVEGIGHPHRLFLSVNTDEDLARARAMAATPE